MACKGKLRWKYGTKHERQLDPPDPYLKGEVKYDAMSLVWLSGFRCPSISGLPKSHRIATMPQRVNLADEDGKEKKRTLVVPHTIPSRFSSPNSLTADRSAR